MKIRAKAFTIIGITVVLLLTGIHFASNVFLRQSITKQEQLVVEQNVRRMLKLISSQLDALNASSGDWAQWDDTYNFINDKNSEYIKTNLEKTTFINLKLNLMVFINRQGGLVAGKAFDYQTKSETEISEGLKVHIRPGSVLLDHENEISAASGILVLPEGLMLVSARPVTTSDAASPANGTLIMGRYLSDHVIEGLEQLTYSSIIIHRLDAAETNVTYKAVLDRMKFHDDIVIKPINDGFISGYVVVRDIYGKPAALLSLKMPRNIYRLGLTSLGFFSGSILVGGLALFLVCVFLMQKTVISRLEALNRFMEETSATRDMTGRVSLTGSDEIAHLAQATNLMLVEVDKAHSELQEREKQLQYVLEATNDGYWDWDCSSDEIYSSPRCLEILGYREGEMENTWDLWKTLIHPDDLPGVEGGLMANLMGEAEFYVAEQRLLTKSREWKWTLIRGKVVERTASGTPLRMTGTLTDITDRKKTEEEILFLSFHDKLTGLYNRAYFEKMLEETDRKGIIPYTVILGDLNGLKLVNDAFGHMEGDKLLCTIGGILASCCRDGGIIARWGGDEFAILLPGKAETDCANICNQIRTACSISTSCQVKPSIALGSAAKLHYGQDIHTVLKEAEEKMYRNKLLESKSNRNALIISLEQTLAEKSYETEEHTRRIRQLCTQVAQAIGLAEDKKDELTLLATLHDIGKVAIPDQILMKPDKLTPEEWEIMKKHSEIGYRIALSTVELNHIAQAILSHHEKYDGTGYPQGIKGDRIPITSRILTIVDAYDVMTHERPYKKAVSREDAVKELVRCAGIQFDPVLVDIFIPIVCGCMPGTIPAGQAADQSESPLYPPK